MKTPNNPLHRNLKDWVTVDEHGEAIKRHQAEYKRLQDRINAMYVDKLDGIVHAAF